MSAAPRRLVLSPEEWAVLGAGLPAEVPPAFAPLPVPPQLRNRALASLVRKGVVLAPRGAPAEPVPAVAAQLAVLRRPTFTVRLEITGRAGERSGWFAVGSGVAAGVLALPGRRVELSLAPAVRLGSELARAVPEAGAVTGPWPGEEAWGGVPPGEEAWGGVPPGEEAWGGVPPAGQLPLSLLEDAPSDGAPPEELALARELERRTGGSLSCLVLGRGGTGLLAGQICWLATDAGWTGLRPRAGGPAGRRVDLLPVEPVDLGTWVAPAAAVLLEALDGAG